MSEPRINEAARAAMQKMLAGWQASVSKAWETHRASKDLPVARLEIQAEATAISECLKEVERFLARCTSESESEPEPESWPTLCPACDGAGERLESGDGCGTCGGTGEVDGNP